LSRNESGRFGALKSDSTHHFFRNACTKSGSLRFSQFSGCWLILSVYILMSFDFPFIRLFGVRWFYDYPYFRIWLSLWYLFFEYDYPFDIFSSNMIIPLVSFLRIWLPLWYLFFEYDYSFDIFSSNMITPLISFLRIWLPLWYLFFDYDYPFGIFKLFLTLK
jgi:hypothetical protein